MDNFVDFRRYLPIASVAALSILMSIVAYGGHVPPSIAAHGVDKVLHLAMSFLLTLALGRALRGRVALAAIAVLSVLAIDEYAQRFSSVRSSDWADLAADFAGSMLAIACARAQRARRLRL
jgi:VanZ family protein